MHICSIRLDENTKEVALSSNTIKLYKRKQFRLQPTILALMTFVAQDQSMYWALLASAKIFRRPFARRASEFLGQFVSRYISYRNILGFFTKKNTICRTTCWTIWLSWPYGGWHYYWPDFTMTSIPSIELVENNLTLFIVTLFRIYWDRR